MRTASPARDHARLEDHAEYDVVNWEASVALMPEGADVRLETPVHTHPQVYNDDMTAGEFATPDSNDSSFMVTVEVPKINLPGTDISHQVQPYPEASPSTGSTESDPGSTIPPAQETPGTDYSTETQILPMTSTAKVIMDVDGMDSLTGGVARTSLEVQSSKKKRSSFTFSITSSCSATSQSTLPSVRSILTNPSLRYLSGSFISILSMRSSNRSLRRASTVPSEMAAPLLSQIDEELENSRGITSRFERYMPGGRYKAWQRALHERLLAAASTNHVEDAIVILARGRGIIDINCQDENGFTPLFLAACHGHEGVLKVLLESGRGMIDVNRADESGSTPLLEAARRGHEDIVTVLLEQEHIDIHRQDSQEFTAVQRAHHHRHSNIVDQLEAYRLYERANKGKEDRDIDMGGICCEMLALPPKPLNRAYFGSAENQRALWQAC
jgi:hypothetical protein